MLLRNFYEHGRFEGKRQICQKVTAIGPLVQGCVFHALLCALSGYLVFQFPVLVLTWSAVCVGIAVHAVRTF